MFAVVPQTRLVVVTTCKKSTNKTKIKKRTSVNADDFTMRGFLEKIFAPDGEVDYVEFNKNSKYAIKIDKHKGKNKKW